MPLGTCSQHGVHAADDVAPTTPLHEPTTQSEQAPAPPQLKLPAKHGTGAADPPEHPNPGGHSVPTSAVDPAAQKLPAVTANALHATHTPDDENIPTGQFDESNTVVEDTDADAVADADAEAVAEAEAEVDADAERV